MPKFRGLKSPNNQLIIDSFILPNTFNPNTFNPDAFGANPSGLSSFTFKALIDTGASKSTISKRVIEKCDLREKGKTQMISASHVVNVNVYNIYVGLPITEGRQIISAEGTLVEDFQMHTKWFFTDVVEMPGLDSRFDMLLGMDILQDCLLIVDGDLFTLAF